MPSIQLPEKIPGSILSNQKLNMNTKRVCAQLAYRGADSRFVRISQAWLADRLHLTRQTVNRAIQQLLDLKLIKLRSAGRVKSYRLAFNSNAKKFFLVVDNNSSGYSWSTRLVFHYLKFRQNKNDAAWPHLSTISCDLGLDKKTVITAIAEIEKLGSCQVIRVHGGLKQHNRYRLKSSLPVTQFHTKAGSGVENCYTKINTIGKGKEFNAEISNSRLVIKQANRKRRLLTQYGVKLSVANDIAADERVTVDTIENAILNGLARQDKSRLWRLQPGYIIAAINQANREQHGVSQSRGTKAIRASIASVKANQQASTKRLSDPAERSAWIENQKRLLEVA